MKLQEVRCPRCNKLICKAALVDGTAVVVEGECDRKSCRKRPDRGRFEVIVRRPEHRTAA